MVSKFFKKESPLVGLSGMGGGLGLFKAAGGSVLFNAEFLVIAGGGQHSEAIGHARGGGGAGGYISSVSGESSGGGTSALTAPTLITGVTYSVTVGAAGSNSQFAGTDALGTSFDHTAIRGGGAAATGGSGGGGTIASGSATAGGAGTTGQGYNGGTSNCPYVECILSEYYCHPYCHTQTYPGGGGGAGAAGGGPNGGNGVQSSITGVATYYAGGGAARSICSSSTTTGTAGQGQTNYGGGGTLGGLGQNGVVILRYATTVTLSNPGGGLTISSSVVSGNNVSIISAGTGNIEFS